MTSTTQREDGQIVADLIAAADRADAAGVAEAARAVSDMMRNWATHIPWEDLEEFDGLAPEAQRRFLEVEFPAVRADLEPMWEPAVAAARLDPDEEHALDKNAYDFFRPVGRDLLARTEEFHGWVQARRRTETWQYSRVLEAAPGGIATITNDLSKPARGINFNSQDYLSFNTHPAVREAALRAMRDFGPHSAGSPMVLGNTRISDELEVALGELVGLEHVTLFSTGWSAGFGTVTGLVRQEDHILIDRLAHSCLQSGARAATRNITRYAHLDVEAVRAHLVEIRATDSRNGILVITDGLFSVDSDWPDVLALQELCHAFDATLLVDVAHDLGSMGPGGTGVLGVQEMVGRVDLVMGAFSKSFASNGGFVAARSPAVKQYIKMFAGSHFFSNALSPVQTAVVLEAARIIGTAEGDALRARLFTAIHALRDELTDRGLTCMGSPSPIVPVLIGNEKLARTVNRLLFDRGVLAFMVEFPVTPTGASRFRLQVQAAHEPEQARSAARTIEEALRDAREYLSSAFGNEF
ncbi:aminotransferase class I/II-fold pyridoxal phosphate-dependent enzyme [Actinokineospora pegani]|uniref:aminotransferase class I/II-fold pyridoxal phosphate-dependent enzyme n=1 Tax=Actinokineospora pegani TaxID=2654637 RepID=UPI0012EA4A3C|nr:aminotransferase class I/II-fold pyridoxal phosphate-dependent enzyme [Actinokineospora pegani]